MTKKKVLPLMPQEDDEEELEILDTSGDENDDWLQKSNPKAYAEELRIHDELAEKHAGKSQGDGQKK